MCAYAADDSWVGFSARIHATICVRSHDDDATIVLDPTGEQLSLKGISRRGSRKLNGG